MLFSGLEDSIAILVFSVFFYFKIFVHYLILKFVSTVYFSDLNSIQYC